MNTQLQPDDWLKPRGYSNGVMASGQQMIFSGGLIGWNKQCEFETDSFVGQLQQTLENIIDILREANAGPEHIVRLTWYVTDRQEYKANLKEIGMVYREVIGRHYPPMAVVEVSGLIEDRAKVEIEMTAIK
ncbi:MAG: RidA family protein [Porticoccaceae bacterium]